MSYTLMSICERLLNYFRFNKKESKIPFHLFHSFTEDIIFSLYRSYYIIKFD